MAAHGSLTEEGFSSSPEQLSPRNEFMPIYGMPAVMPSPMMPSPMMIYPGNASPTHHEQNHREKLSETNLYIRGLSADTTDAKLHQMCERFGKIVSTKAIIDNETTKCKGYGFVDFELPEAAQKAVQKLTSEGHLVQMAKKQEEDPTNIYFSNLPDWIGDKSLREMLEPYGEVVSTRILRHPGQNGSEGRSKGVGFARMHKADQCEKIIEKFNGQPLTDPKDVTKSTVKPLLVKFADGGPKKKKSHQLNITTAFRRDPADMMMGELPVPIAPFPFAMHAGIPYSNILPSYSQTYPAYPQHIAGGVPFHDFNGVPSPGFAMPFMQVMPYDHGAGDSSTHQTE